MTVECELFKLVIHAGCRFVRECECSFWWGRFIVRRRELFFSFLSEQLLAFRWDHLVIVGKSVSDFAVLASVFSSLFILGARCRKVSPLFLERHSLEGGPFPFLGGPAVAGPTGSPNPPAYRGGFAPRILPFLEAF